jgi:hypothetical protein
MWPLLWTIYSFDYWNWVMRYWVSLFLMPPESQGKEAAESMLEIEPYESILRIQRIWSCKESIDRMVQMSFELLMSASIPDTESGKKFREYSIFMIENLYLLRIEEGCKKTCHIAYC